MANLYGMSKNPGYQCTQESTFTSPSSSNSSSSRLSVSSRKRSNGKECTGNKSNKKSKGDAAKSARFAVPHVTPAEKKKAAAEEGTQDENYNEQFDGLGRVPDDIFDSQRIAEIDEMVAKAQSKTGQEGKNNEDSEVECLSDMYCGACGNYEQGCHQTNLGSLLIHEVISMYEKRDEKGKALVDFDCIHEYMKLMYNIHLHGGCYKSFEVFDVKEDNELPPCIKKSSLHFVADVIKKVQIYQLLKTKREYGAAARLMKDGKDLWKF